MSAITSHEIERRLLEKHPGERWVCISEARNGTGFGRDTRTADFVAIDTWPSGGCRIIGFEIKVSRHDFERELADPTKRAWLEDQMTECYFVTPKDMLDPAEIPEGWGLLEARGDKQLRKVRLARQTKNEPRKKLWIAMLRAVHRRDEDLRERAERWATVLGKPVSLDQLEKLSAIHLQHQRNQLEKLLLSARDARRLGRSFAEEWQRVFGAMAILMRDENLQPAGLDSMRRFGSAEHPNDPEAALEWIQQLATHLRAQRQAESGLRRAHEALAQLFDRQAEVLS